jgi:hypothetical protein
MTLALAACASNISWTRGPEADPNLSLEQRRAQCSGTTFCNGNVDDSGFRPEQRERRRAYLKAWRAKHREHCIACDKHQRQKPANNAVLIMRAGARRTGNKSLVGGSTTTKKIESASTKRGRNVAGRKGSKASGAPGSRFS